MVWKDGLDLTTSGQYLILGFREKGNYISGYIKARNFLTT